MRYSRPVARPTGVRTLAGYTLGERVAQDVYGEVYRASEGKRSFTLLVVDPRLAGDDAFADALSGGTASRLGSFHHRAVVGTVVVAQDGKSLVVVTEGTGGTTSLAEVLQRARARGGNVPERIAAAVARAVIDGLATAHAAGIVHGALHPRSVLIDAEGNVRVTDFAVGHAAMTAAAHGSQALSLKGLAGYLAPELALGDPPSPACDVYAIGALLFTMLTGDTPPGSLSSSPAISRLVQRALDTDLARRFHSAVELQENFTEALEDDRWECAPPAEIARHVAEHAAAAGHDSNLDAATEDLLASLGGAVDVTRPSAGNGHHLDAVLSDLEDTSTDGPLTVVDDHRRGQVARDPISELIALDRGETSGDHGGDLHEPTPLPAPAPDEPGTFTRQGTDVRPMPRRAEPAPQPSRLVEKTRPKSKMEATPPPERVEEKPSVPPPAAAAPPPNEAPKMRFVRPADEPDAHPPVPSLKRSPIWTVLGLLVIVGVGGFLGYRLVLQKDELSAAEKAAAAEKERKEKEAQDLTRRLTAEQADPGTIEIRSTPDEAAVWVLLGRTPFDSMHLKTKNVWELRVELEGHVTQDVRIGGAGWTGPDQDRKASIDIKLVAGENQPPLPAMPPAPPASDQAGLVDGSGTLHATSTPPGAAVWLLVGVTNTMSLSGIEAGQSYELKVTKDGFLPGYVRIAAEEWRQGGDPRLPLSAAPKRERLERSVELTPAPAKKPR